MPELPEVENVRRNINPFVLNRKIKIETLADVKLFKTPQEEINKVLSGNEFSRIDRLGKYLFFRLKDSIYSLCIHLGMSGQLYARNAPIKKDHLHFVLDLAGQKLWYRDPRRFGKIFLFETDNPKKHNLLKKVGPDALSITPEYLIKAIKKNRPIKVQLMDQAILAGVGNIYADEVLFRIGVHPETKAKTLEDSKIKELHTKLIALLEDSIKAKGASVTYAVGGENEQGSFQDNLFVYRKAGQKCKICETKLEKIEVNQRGTTFCPTCQKQ